MGKFPGKPSKFANRKRIHILKCSTSQENESIRAAEKIYLGLSIFKEKFGRDDEIKDDYHGFDKDHLEKAINYTRLHRTQSEQEFQELGESPPSWEQFENELANDRAVLKLSSEPKMFPATHQQHCFDGGGCHDETTPRKERNRRSALEKPTPVITKLSSRNLKKNAAKKILQKAKKSVSSPSISQGENSPIDRNTNSAGKKFILPTRSAHSSRVIKPVKRFIESEEENNDHEKELPAMASDNNNILSSNINFRNSKLAIDSQHSSHQCNINKNGNIESFPGFKSILEDGTSEKIEFASLCETNGSKKEGWRPYQAHLKLKELNVFGAGTSDIPFINSLPDINKVPEFEESKDKPVSKSSKIILRQPTLKLNNENGSQGSPTSPAHITTGTMVCGVCGALRFYRFIKQARKFGIYSCESCRKFISKMIRRYDHSKDKDSRLQCATGTGKCPIQLSSQIKKKDKLIQGPKRCQVCWLKLCLRSFDMPNEKRESLALLLPPTMRNDIDFIPNLIQKRDSKSEGTHTARIDKVLNRKPFGKKSPKRENEKIIINVNKKSKKPVASPPIDIKIIRNKKSPRKNGNILNNKNRTKRNRLRSSSGLSNKSSSKSNKPPSSDLTRRQRLDLKGPRVKHVCRSASIVLGIAQAVFPQSPPIQLKASLPPVETNLHSIPTATEYKKSSKSSNQETVKQIVESTTSIKTKVIEHNESHLANDVSQTPAENITNIPAPSSRKNNNKPTITPVSTLPNLQSLVAAANSKNNGSTVSHQQPSLISIDFWESYDPEEVSLSGLSLIGSEPFHILATCFVCGSAGHEELIHCASCCEPYHRFCLEDGLRVSLPNNDSGWQYNWLCQRCAVCHACQRVGKGVQLACHRCRRTYHQDCLPEHKLRVHGPSTDNPWLCSACLRCKSCNAANVSLYVGNLPLCKPCFKLRKKGNYCPLCQRCYEDNDFDTKMMECGTCKCWIHAKCEGISDEKYQVLSFLPDSIEFICRNCCTSPPAPWWLAVEKELRAGYLGVLKALSKNRKANSVLKFSPLKKQCTCRSRLGKRLKFPGFGEDTTSSQSVDDIKELKEETRINEESLDFLTLSKNSDKIRSLREKYNIKECTVRVKNCAQRPKSPISIRVEDGDQGILSDGSGRSPALAPSDSGVGSTDDEFKPSGSIEEDTEDKNIDPGYNSNEEDLPQFECRCRHHSNSMLQIKAKVIANQYPSLQAFNQDMERFIISAQCSDLLDTYHHTLQEVFPWFDPRYSCVNTSVCKDQVRDSGFADSKLKLDIDINESLLEINSELTKRLIDKPKDYFYNGLNVEEFRICILCKEMGDGLPEERGRLLYCGQNEWIHANCALWSAEVFEEIDGSLQNVHRAMSRGRLISCALCGKKGASVGCCARNCQETYHFMCARQASCLFLDDKRVFCSSHKQNESNAKYNTDFKIARPIYVELDRKKKKYAEPNQVRFSVGSLSVTHLGEFVPSVSDNINMIIPIEFRCTRLYWSSIEPWRIVQYHIKTIIKAIVPQTIIEPNRNYVVDHSQKDEIVRQKMDEIYRWHQDLERSYYPSQDEEMFVARQVMDHILDLVCSSNEDPDSQNAADLLPPELSDAIFEDLPYDLLDGISMQDILPKLMNYDDLVNLDLKTENCFSETLKDIKEDLIEDSFLNSDVESLTKEEQNNWNYKEVTEDVQNINSKRVKELKRSNSEIINQALGRKIAANRSQQRSCSLTWNCKLEATSTTSKSRRKITRSLAKSDNSEDKTSKLHELRLPESVTVSLAASLTSEKDFKLRFEEGSSSTETNSKKKNTQKIEHGKENKFLIWQSRSIPRISQLDGTADGSDSEISSPPHHSFPSKDEQPVRCTRCHRTYRTMESHQRHLPTCNSEFILSTSDSEQEDDTRTKTKPESSIVLETPPLIPTKNKPNLKNRNKAKTSRRTNKEKAQPNLARMVMSQTPIVQCQQNTAPPTLLVQQVASQSMIPTLVEAFQQQTGAGLQYIATINAHNSPYGKPQLVLQGGNLSVLPSVQPTVLGTLIPPPQPAAIHVSADQVVLGSTPGIEMFTDQNGGMFVTSQPMYYGLETIVSNTVMQSSQYVSGTMPGVPGMVAASSSFQSTTQVFQTGKIESIPAGYVIVNPQHSTMSESTISSSSEVMACQGSLIPQPQRTQAPPSHPPNLTPVVSLPQVSHPHHIITNTSIPTHNPQLWTNHQNMNHMINQQSKVQINQNVYTPDSSSHTQIYHRTTPPCKRAKIEYSPTSTVQEIKLPSHQVVKPKAIPASLANSLIIPCSSSKPASINLTNTLSHIVPSKTLKTSSSTHYEMVRQNSNNTSIAHNSNNIKDINQSFESISPRINATNNSKFALNISQNSQVPIFTNTNTYSSTNNSSLLNASINLKENISLSTKSLAKDTNSLSSYTPIFNSTNNSYINSNFSSNQSLPSKTISINHSKEISPDLSINGNIHQPKNISPSTSIIANEYLLTSLKSTDIKELPSSSKNNPIKFSKLITESQNNLQSKSPTPKNTLPPNSNSLLMLSTTNSNNQSNNSAHLISPNYSPCNNSQNTNNTNPTQHSTNSSPIQIKINNKAKPIEINQNSKMSLNVSSIAVPISKPNNVNNNLPSIPLIPMNTNQLPLRVIQKTNPIKANKEDLLKLPTANSNKKLWSSMVKKEKPSAHISYEVHSQDGFHFTSSSLSEVWQRVFEAVQEARVTNKMPPLPKNPFEGGAQALGLKHNALRYLLEQIPGANRCVKYKPRYNKLRPPPTEEESIDAPPRENPSGSVRTEAFCSRAPFDLFSWLASRHRKAPKLIAPSDNDSAISTRRATSSNLPMAMRFRHLKETSKASVGVYRSTIHGRGLFCLRDIEAGEMVIEYAGEVIRSSLTDKREKYYESRDIGCYMFRIDDHLVVDATLRGNAARFINHSCEPNCYSRVVDILGKKHILIFAFRRIPQGEELTYDYKFPFEDIKIPCTCGSRRCRKYLN